MSTHVHWRAVMLTSVHKTCICMHIRLKGRDHKCMTHNGHVYVITYIPMYMHVFGYAERHDYVRATYTARGMTYRPHVQQDRDYVRAT